MADNIFSKIFSGIRSFSKPRSVVGIDIGSSSVKIVQLRKEKEQAVLETYGELAMGPYTKRHAGEIVHLTEENMSSVLQDLFRETGATAKSAVVALPVRSSFITTVKLPLVDGEKNLGDIIGFEARKFIPVPLNEVEMNWWVLSESGEQTKMVEILLVATHKEVIQKYKNIISRAGLRLESFEVEIFGSWRSCVVHQIAPTMIIDLGAASSKMSVLEKGMLKSSHIVDKGAQLITASISNSLKISFDRAEELKREVGLSPQPEYKELSNVIESILGIIFAEAKQFMLGYQRRYESSVGRVVLSGGGALLRGVTDFAVKNLGVEVSLADPFSRIRHPVVLQETLREIGPSFATATGLALKAL